MESPTKSERKPRNIFELAIRERDEQEEKSAGDETTVLVVGSKSSGKSTIIQRFLDRSSDGTKPTLALEYTYGRKSRSNDLGKDIVHLWELGGGTTSVDLMETVISATNIEAFKCVIVVDLSRPKELWLTLETLLNSVKARVDKIVASEKAKDGSLLPRLKKNMWALLGESHTDKSMIDPILVPVVIVGMKYDVFKDFDPEHRKVICKTLRFMAHVHGASILTASDKDESLISRCKAMMNSLAFRGPFSRSSSFDHDKPLLIPAGSDSLAQIGAPSVLKDDPSKLGARNPIELWKSAYAQYFPAEGEEHNLPEDPSRNPKYKEKAVDDMRMQKDEELERYRRKAERRARELAAKHAAKEAKGSSKSRPKKPTKPSSGSSKPRRPQFGAKVDTTS